VRKAVGFLCLAFVLDRPSGGDSSFHFSSLCEFHPLLPFALQVESKLRFNGSAVSWVLARRSLAATDAAYEEFDNTRSTTSILGFILYIRDFVENGFPQT